MDWRHKKVLVTGGAGFIGSHLSEALVAAGASVTVFARYTANGLGAAFLDIPKPVRDEIEVIAGDLRDSSAILDAVAGKDVVFHLAAHIGIPYSYVHPLDVAQVNVMGTAHVLEAARRSGTGRVVLFSTSEVYGTAQYAPIDEEHPLHPQSPYAASKVAADQLGLSYARSFGLPVTLCRPFNTYGPRQPPRAVLPTIITQALSGDVIRLGSLTPTRDLLYVADTVAGAMRIAEEEATVGEVLNLATGTEISVGDLADTVIGLLGGDKRVEDDPSRVRPASSEVMRLIGSSAKAGDLVGWRPSHDLSQGVRKTIDWFAAEQRRIHDADAYRI